jgi:hypothetical protein
VPEKPGDVAAEFGQLTENDGDVPVECGELPEEARQLDLIIRFALME